MKEIILRRLMEKGVRAITKRKNSIFFAQYEVVIEGTSYYVIDRETKQKTNFTFNYEPLERPLSESVERILTFMYLMPSFDYYIHQDIHTLKINQFTYRFMEYAIQPVVETQELNFSDLYYVKKVAQHVFQRPLTEQEKQKVITLAHNVRITAFDVELLMAHFHKVEHFPATVRTVKDLMIFLLLDLQNKWMITDFDRSLTKAQCLHKLSSKQELSAPMRAFIKFYSIVYDHQVEKREYWCQLFMKQLSTLYLVEEKDFDENEQFPNVYYELLNMDEYIAAEKVKHEHVLQLRAKQEQQLREQQIAQEQMHQQQLLIKQQQVEILEQEALQQLAWEMKQLDEARFDFIHTMQIDYEKIKPYLNEVLFVEKNEVNRQRNNFTQLILSAVFKPLGQSTSIYTLELKDKEHELFQQLHYGHGLYVKIVPECFQLIKSYLIDMTLIFSTDEAFCRAYRTNPVVLPKPNVFETQLSFDVGSEHLKEITLIEGVYGQIELKLSAHEKTPYAVMAYTMEGEFLGYLKQKPSLQLIAALNANQPMYTMVSDVGKSYFQNDYYFTVYVTNEASLYQQQFDQLLSDSNSALAQISKEHPKMTGFYKIVGEKFGEFSKSLMQLNSGETVYLERQPYNNHDKYAVAAYVNGKRLGYIGKPENKKFEVQLRQQGTITGTLIKTGHLQIYTEFYIQL